MISLILGLVNIACFILNYTHGNYGVASFNIFVAGWCISASVGGR